MRRRMIAVAGVTAAALAGCIPEKAVGYVEIRAFPVPAAPLYINTVRIAELSNGSALLTQDVGRASLQVQRNGQFFTMCEFDVRKNRIVTVTVSAVERAPRCTVKS